MPSIRLTDARIKALKPAQKTRDVRDATLRGFGVRVLASGRKRYFIHTQFDGQRIWKLIGDANQTSLADARKSARTILSAVRKGLPAVASPDETRFEVFAEEAFRSQSRRWKPSTLKVNRWYLNNQILPWFRGRQISDITRRDVQNWFISLHATPFAADRSAPVLSVIMTQAEIYGHRPAGTNPCKGIRRYRRKGRERFLSEAELRRLGDVLSLRATERQRPAAIIVLLLLTGCRVGEIRTLQWRDLRDGHLHLRDSKTGPRTVWLSTPSRDVLNGLPKTSRWVFPSPRAGGPVSKSAVEKFWFRVRSDAKLNDVRLHDLRHTYASLAIMTGETVPVVGRLLGHNDSETTLKYAHLSEATVHDAADMMGIFLAGRGA